MLSSTHLCDGDVFNQNPGRIRSKHRPDSASSRYAVNERDEDGSEELAEEIDASHGRIQFCRCSFSTQRQRSLL